MQTIQKMHPPTTLKQVHASLDLVGYYRKYIKNFAKIAKLLTLLSCQQVKFNWTPNHHEAFLHLKESITQVPILHYPDPNKRYIVYTDASDEACGLQLSMNMMVQNIQLLFFCTLFQKLKENGAQLNRKLMEFIMPLQNENIISKEWIS